MVGSIKFRVKFRSSGRNHSRGLTLRSHIAALFSKISNCKFMEWAYSVVFMIRHNENGIVLISKRCLQSQGGVDCLVSNRDQYFPFTHRVQGTVRVCFSFNITTLNVGQVRSSLQRDKHQKSTWQLGFEPRAVRLEKLTFCPPTIVLSERHREKYCCFYITWKSYERVFDGMLPFFLLVLIRQLKLFEHLGRWETAQRSPKATNDLICQTVI